MTTNSPKSPKIPRKPRSQAVEFVMVEMQSMRKSLVIYNAIVLLAFGVYGIVTREFDWSVLTGLLLGNTATLLNFYALGVKTDNILRSKNAGYAKRYATVGFFLRYFGAFAVFGILIHLGFVNIFASLIPLFYPKIYYTLKALKHKSV
jgi:hypothetical protein